MFAEGVQTTLVLDMNYLFSVRSRSPSVSARRQIDVNISKHGGSDMKVLTWETSMFLIAAMKAWLLFKSFSGVSSIRLIASVENETNV